MNRIIKIGLLVTVSSLAAIIFMMMTADKVSGGDSYTVSAYLTDATGLLPDSKVRMYGVVIGSVKDIVLEEDRARVDMTLSDDSAIYEDAVFEKRMESLLGTASVTIQPGTPSKRRLSNGAVIESVQSGTALEQTFSTLRDISESGDMMLEDVEKLFSGGYEQMTSQEASVMEQTLVEVRWAFKHINSILTDIDGITTAVEQRSRGDLERFNQLMAQMTILTANLNALIEENEERIATNMDRMDRSIEIVNSQLESSEAILNEIHSIAKTINSGEGSIGKLVRDETLYNRVVSLTEEAEEAVKSTIGIDVEVDYNGSYLVNQGAMRNQVGIKLTPGSDDKYYTAGIVDRPGVGNTTTTTTTTTTGGTTTTSVSEEVVSGWVPYLQLAYGFGPVTLRGGLIEGSGGLGVDYNPLKAASLSFEAYNFDSVSNPNIRLYSAIFPFSRLSSSNPLSWVYINGGVDDMLGKSQFDYFFGAGLRFQDNDLKGLATIVPISP